MTLSQPDIQGLTIIGFCLIMSAFFSGSETAITTMGTMKARHLLEQKGKRVKQLKLWLDYPSRVLTTILIFNNVFNIAASAEATVIAHRHFGDQAVSIATGVVTFLVLIFGEVVPKAFARSHYEGLAVFSMRIIWISYVVFYPLIWLLSGFANFIVAYLGRKRELQPEITEDEIEFLINEGEKAGVIEDTKKDMITGVFDFDETKVREVMTPRTDMVMIDENTVFDEATELVVQSGHSRIPVYRDKVDNIIGIVFAKDLLGAISAKDRTTKRASDLMREPLFVPESNPLMDVFKDLKRTKNHLAVVIDEYGGTAGIVTMEDILEEIVGDIQDEFDDEEADIMDIGENTYDVSGSISLSDFIEHFQPSENFFNETAGEVDTLAGWMTQIIGELPEEGQSLTKGPLTFEVINVSRHRINRVRVVKRVVKKA